MAGCGGSSSGTSSSNASGPGAGGRGGGSGFAQDPKVAACLKKQGVTIPARPAGGRGGRGTGVPGGGQGPSGGGAPPADGTAPGGAPPQGTPPARLGGQSDAERAKFQAALKKCGVTLPQGRRPGADGAGAPGATAPATPATPSGTTTGPTS